MPAINELLRITGGHCYLIRYTDANSRKAHRAILKWMRNRELPFGMVDQIAMSLAVPRSELEQRMELKSPERKAWESQ